MRFLFYFVLCIIFFSCNSSKKNISQFNWIVGSWEGNLNDSTIIFEKWQLENDSLIKGVGGMIIHNDTVFFEKVSILQKGNDFYYRADVSENETFVDFKYLGLINDSAIFENKLHDFPQRVIYYHIQNGMYAYVDGMSNGKYRKENFEFEKKSK